VCMRRGAWDEAERELSAATDELAACRPAMTGEGFARLGELRRRQGRLDEAMALFDRAGAHPMASLGRAMVAFDRGDHKAAAELVDRYLRKLPLQNRTERAAGLELLSRAQIELGDGVDAHKALEELRDIAARAQTDPLRASASLAAGIVFARSGDPAAARRHLEDAVDLFQKGGAPFETARARVELARVLGRLGRLEPAVEEAQRAIDDFVQLHAGLELSRARDVLENLRTEKRTAPQPEPVSQRGGLTVRELEVLRLISIGLGNHAIAQRLFISEHTVHRHVANMLTKLNVSSRSAAVAQVARQGVL
jgi:LuxR family maltose regulon positive regulatory protein